MMLYKNTKAMLLSFDGKTEYLNIIPVYNLPRQQKETYLIKTA